MTTQSTPMDEETLKAIAQQLRKPEGEFGNKVGEKMNEGNLTINQYTIDELRIQPQDTILEIGMGNGFFVKDILAVDSSVRYIGCDFSEEMVADACQRNEPFIANGQALFYTAAAENLPLMDGSIDKIFTVNTLYFWENPAQILAECRRILKPGGQLLIAIRPKSVMVTYPFAKYGFTMYSKEEVNQLLLANQFVIVRNIEKKEPSSLSFGELLEMETLIVCAEK